MKGFVSLPAEERGKKFQVGDLTRIDLLLEEKVEGDQGSWSVKSEGGLYWTVSGSLTVFAKEIKPIQSEGNTTKLSLEAIVHQAGPLQIGELKLIHSPSGKEVVVQPSDLNVSTEPTQTGEEKPLWILPPEPFGGFNWYVLIPLALLLLSIFGFLIFRYFSKVRKKKSLDHRSKAFLALQTLQKSFKNKKGIKQEEWKKFSFELAGIIRRYSDDNFQMDSSDLTDREFLRELRNHPKALPLVEKITHILSTIDAVRYGKQELDASLVPGLLQETRDFIDHTFHSQEEKKSP